MIQHNSITPTHTAFRIVIIYSIVGCLWILFSDRLLELLVEDSHQLVRFAIYKGWAYVGLTALLLYLLIRRYIARQMAMDQERIRSQAALLAAEGRFRDLLETVHLVAVMLDHECRITFCNDFLLKLTGWTLDEIIGRNWIDVFIPEEERPGVQAVNSSIQAENIVPHFENHILTKSGDRRLIYWNNTLLRDPDGAIAGTASIGVDVTDHRRLDQERRQLDQQMLQAQKLESLEILAGGIAHDFNNILAVVMGNAELAMKSLDSRETVTKHLDRIQNAATKAAGLARQMLAYSGRGVFSVTPLNLSELLDDLRNILESSISRKATLTLNLAQQLPIIKGDAAQLRQVVTSLVLNSSEAIGDENGWITVTTDCAEYDAETLNAICQPMQLPAGRYVYLDVADNGCGMDEGTVARIFDPFFTTKFTGRGLGMAAVIGIIRGHGGAICVTTKPGQGSTFRVLLPVCDSTQEIRVIS